MNASNDDSRRKRRAIVQGLTACNPCRARKVRCSFESPCQTCMNREHPELCVYRAPSKRISLQSADRHHRYPGSGDHASPVASWPPSEQDWNALQRRVEELEACVALTQHPRSPGHGSGMPGDDVTTQAEAPALVDSPDTVVPLSNRYSLHATPAASSQPDVYAKHTVTGERVFLGANCVAAMALALTSSDESNAVQGLIGRSVLPIFALENDTATYPFVDIWGLPHTSVERIQRLCALLPIDADCLNFLSYYRGSAHILFPAIIHIQQFEAQVTQFLAARAAGAAHVSMRTSGPSPVHDQNTVYGHDLHWLGLFFACMASGCQCSNMERKQRQLTSQVYVCCAYECLRLVNYLSCSKLEDVQNLLILGNVLSNNMNAGVAWTLLGLTIRIAQGLGLHHAPPTDTSGFEANTRYQIWSRIIWQDSLLSITYDRATSISSMTKWGSAGPPERENLKYANCMLRLCHIALDVVCSRAMPVTNNQEQLMQIDHQRQQIAAIERRQSHHLEDTSACESVPQLLEHWNWNMHRSYVVSELYRPMLTSRNSIIEQYPYRILCMQALTETVDAFLHLQSLTAFACTSWAAVHRSLSSALLLAILKEPRRNEKVHKLINRLIAVMSSMESENASEVSAPVARAVMALSRLNMVTEDQDSAMDTEDSMPKSSPYAQVHGILWGNPDENGSLKT